MKYNGIIYQPEYEFLRTNENLQGNMVYLTLGGSHAYGTNVEGSDVDVRGIAIEGDNVIFGLQSFEQVVHKETDTTIYGLKKFFNLCINANPNVLELLGTDINHVLRSTVYSEMLRGNIDMFLSQKVISSFGGYAYAQLRRLQNSLARDSYTQHEKEVHILNTLKHQFEHFRNRYESFDDGAITLYIDNSKKEEFDKEIFMNLELKKYPLRDFKAIYSEMNNIVKEYGKLNHRNNKKSDEKLYKHAMHLIRLFEMGTEILEGKGVNTLRSNKDFLLDIRNEKYSYEQIFEMVDELEKKFKYASDNTELPKTPNYKKLENLLMEIHGLWHNVDLEV